MLVLPDDWLWDFWLADDGERYHFFFLKAPRSLGNPDLRHWNTSIGHAVSADLTAWTVLPDAIAPAIGPAFDDFTTWTGSAVRADDGTWLLFYTGTSRGDAILTQRIGVAMSPDLQTWTKRGTEPICVSDPRWYLQGVDPLGPDEAWRDPWVFRDPDGDGWHMLITARAKDGPADQRGVVGHARSRNLIDWEVGPPLSEPGRGFSHLEVFQIAEVEDRWVLVFSCLHAELSDERRARGETGGVWIVETPGPLGPFDPACALRLTDESLYAGRMIQRRDGAWVLLAFVNRDADGAFAGALSDPIPLDRALERARAGSVWTARG